MITPDQYFGKYDQKFVDYDGNKKYWCVDNYRQFVKECLNFPQSPIVAGAKNIWTTYLTEYFDRILNTIEAIPIKGDIIIWGSGVGADGHVGICKDGNQMQFTSMDQNWPLGSPCHFVPHNYNNVLGWLRVKTIEQTQPIPPAPVPTPEPIPEPAVPSPEPIPAPPVPEPTIPPVEWPAPSNPPAPKLSILAKIVNWLKDLLSSNKRAI